MTATLTPPEVAETPQEQKSRGLALGRKPSASAVKLNLSGEPTVQLLPSTIRDRSLARSRVRTGVLLVILGVIVAAALVAVGTLRNTQAQDALNAANDDTTDLIGQQAQYADAVKINGLVEQIKELQKGATSTEIDWASLVRKLLAKLPAGAYILTIDAANVAPWEQMPTVGSSDEPQIATLSLSLSTLTIQDATAFSRSLSDLDGFAAATVAKVAVGTDGRVTTQLGLVLTTGAESGRFTDEAEDSDDASDAAAGETTDAAEDDSAATDGSEG
ncbi:hypothetical protein [Protaetiibacter larvae]|uniref:Fimbrial assembly protein n=1 Tax=Protaetiibacter larvae TaxID=2592654 RepID=A0A5C1Y687_9MICO|nr:hypothetical protein [Protaetiibacter larvae]QEO09230.1 hypothetical protein FLP23_03905 [Protaetiibacter larvae]